ncbi:MAG: HAMP domain-containing protein [Gammaproteobacteria bacterium]|nr:HAMP domain-containing protein [Gammaproteobacteria bacterium]
MHPAAGSGRAGRLMLLRFRSFRGRLLAFILLLLVLIQAGVFFAVQGAVEDNARRTSDEALQVTASALGDALETRRRSLLEKVRLLSGDYAFKSTFGEGDLPTLLSVLENHQGRVRADMMMLLDLDGQVLADTLHPDTRGQAFAFPALLRAAQADDHGEASDLVFIDGSPYQLVLAPLFAPEPAAWPVIGFAIGDAFAKGLAEQTRTEVSLVWLGKDGHARRLAGALPEEAMAQLLLQAPRLAAAEGRSQRLVLAGMAQQALALRLSGDEQGQILAVLSRSLELALAPYQGLQRLLLVVALAGLGLSALGALWLARRVTEPVTRLAAGAEAVARGEFQPVPEPRQDDELGRLARSFNHMVQGLAERDRVRNLLGKVVSPAIAEELMQRPVALGGEERQVSILFSDIREFTSLSEGLPPTELLALLNSYLGRMSRVVDGHGGVVDKYIGDAIMALFGVPLAGVDDPARAVACGLGMVEALEVLNREFAARAWPRLAIGVGIHSGVAVAGNMGSESRWNYSVVGDAVNLASRLEGLCKTYGVPIIVSTPTRAACPGLAFRELDRVQVKGRAEPVGIHQPLGPFDALSPEERGRLRRHGEALVHYRAKDFERALAEFETLAEAQPEDTVARLYIARCRRFLDQGPPGEWAGVTRFDEK